MRIAGVASIAALALAFGGGTATAQTPSERGYDETLGVIGQVDTPSKPKAESAPSQGVTETAPAQAPVTEPVEQSAGDLPFTGLDVGVILGMGILLLGVGIVLRRTINRGPAA